MVLKETKINNKKSGAVPTKIKEAKRNEEATLQSAKSIERRKRGIKRQGRQANRTPRIRQSNRQTSAQAV